MSDKYYKYVTQEGDTFDCIALDYYDDEYKANLIMKANPDHIRTIIFKADIELEIPVLETEIDESTAPPWKR